MKRCFFLGLAVMVLGCGEGDTQTQNVGHCGDGKDSAALVDGSGGSGGDGGAGGMNNKPVDPCEPYVETILPAMGLGDVHVICSSCGGNTCDQLGDPCDMNGAPCTFSGAPGICISCCIETVGELHCSPL
jgi:hypothetical protein